MFQSIASGCIGIEDESPLVSIFHVVRNGESFPVNGWPYIPGSDNMLQI